MERFDKVGNSQAKDVLVKVDTYGSKGGGADDSQVIQQPLTSPNTLIFPLLIRLNPINVCICGKRVSYEGYEQ